MYNDCEKFFGNRDELLFQKIKNNFIVTIFWKGLYPNVSIQFLR